MKIYTVRLVRRYLLFIVLLYISKAYNTLTLSLFYYFLYNIRVARAERASIVAIFDIIVEDFLDYFGLYRVTISLLISLLFSF